VAGRLSLHIIHRRDGCRHGKPALASPAGLHFNVSHTTERLLVVVARDREVGVDAEPVARAGRLAATSRSWLAGPEATALERLPPQEREPALLRLWTFKEAYLKAVGIGLNGDPRETVVGLDARPVLHVARRCRFGRASRRLRRSSSARSCSDGAARAFAIAAH